ncbi:MAG: hypothetical protein ACJ752_04455 [Gaiellaceae bacterium]
MSQEAAAAGLAYAATTGSRGSSQPYASCPVTLPNHAPESPLGPSRKWGYRQGQISVELSPFGVTLVNKRDLTADGSFPVKVGWYRYGRGRLRITATRIDKPGHVNRTSVPAGYGRTGFQASGIDFPSEGCWKVTATVGHSHLTYVTVVLGVFTIQGRVLEF